MSRENLIVTREYTTIDSTSGILKKSSLRTFKFPYLMSLAINTSTPGAHILILINNIIFKTNELQKYISLSNT